MTSSAEYLVNHGRAAFLGRFSNRSGTTLDRGDRVVIRTVRGTEVGTVLGEAATKLAHLVGSEVSGELLRKTNDEDDRRFAELVAAAERIRDDAQLFVDSSGFDVTILDVEILVDGVRAIVQMLPLGELDLESLGEAMSSRYSLEVTIQDLRVPATVLQPVESGCGKPGCGSGGGGCNSCGTGGGCNTSSCSRSAVKNADDMTAYFAGLRKQMEVASGRVPLAGESSGR
jgi:hypothetical protein